MLSRAGDGSAACQRCPMALRTMGNTASAVTPRRKRTSPGGIGVRVLQLDADASGRILDHQNIRVRIVEHGHGLRRTDSAVGLVGPSLRISATEVSTGGPGPAPVAAWEDTVTASVRITPAAATRTRTAGAATFSATQVKRTHLGLIANRRRH